MSTSGYSPDFRESVGDCRECGGSKDYPMLVSKSTVCHAEFHSWKYRVACAIFKRLTGREPRQ